MKWSCGLCSQVFSQGASKVHVFPVFYTFYPVGFAFRLHSSKRTKDLNVSPAMWATYPSA